LIPLLLLLQDWEDASVTQFQALAILKILNCSSNSSVAKSMSHKSKKRDCPQWYAEVSLVISDKDKEYVVSSVEMS